MKFKGQNLVCWGCYFDKKLKSVKFSVDDWSRNTIVIFEESQES
jgi:uncharacterized protein YaiE (UPF0345 family)